MAAQQLLNPFQELPFRTIQFLSPVNRLIVQNNGRNLVVLTSEITCLEGQGNYTFLHTRDGKRYLVSKTLKNYEKILDATMFLRVHKSSIINLKYLQEICVEPDRCVRLKCGREVCISRRKMQEVCEAISQL